MCFGVFDWFRGFGSFGRVWRVCWGFEGFRSLEGLQPWTEEHFFTQVLGRQSKLLDVRS